MAEYAYSLNEEYYTGRYDSREDAAWDGAQDYRDQYDEEPSVIWTGEIVQHKAEEYLPHAESLTEMMQENACDDCEYSDDWLSGLLAEQVNELDTALKNAVKAWADKHRLQPTFYTVEKVEETPAPALEQGE